MQFAEEVQVAPWPPVPAAEQKYPALVQKQPFPAPQVFAARGLHAVAVTQLPPWHSVPAAQQRAPHCLVAGQPAQTPKSGSRLMQ